MKAKLKFIIPIVIAVIAIIVAALCIDFTPRERADVSSIMSTAQKYLIENQYEQAIAEFNKVIEIEPKNVDAYLGLAEVYVGMGDADKAIEILEKGYEITGDERLKEMLDRLLLPVPEETTVTTTVTTVETTTASTSYDEYNNSNFNIVGIEIAEIGDHICFGNYCGEDIIWRVLYKNQNNLLLITEYVIEAKEYNSDLEYLTWEECDLRQWLNNDFYNSAFNINEQEKIMTTHNINPDNPKGHDGGNDTDDKIYLLSIDEALTYFSNDIERRAQPTKHAIDNNVNKYDYMSEEPNHISEWWLRSSSRNYVRSAEAVWIDGKVSSNYDVDYSRIGVRPVMRISIS